MGVHLNNYPYNFDFDNHIQKVEFKVKRAVWGFEEGRLNGTPHVQGYVELTRTARLAHVRKIFDTARWEPAVMNAQVNYQYGTKSGNFGVFGDFTAEKGPKPRKFASHSMIIRGLLDPKNTPQVKVSQEYAERHSYFDKTVRFLKDMERQNSFLRIGEQSSCIPGSFRF